MLLTAVTVSAWLSPPAVMPERLTLCRPASSSMVMFATVLIVGGLFTGAVFVEKIFGWHGMGEWVVQGINSQDTNIVVAITVFTGVTILLAGLLSDVIYAALDPRVRVS